MREAIKDSPAPTARRVMREALRASLGTLLRDSDAAPYVSLVLVATDHDGAPILLLSDLADHTRNLGRDARVSLLLDGTGEREEPLAGERVTLQGRLRRSEEPRHRARYLARHPSAATYADFRDFAFYRMEVERAHLVAGFGRIHWLDGADILIAPRAELVDAEPAIVQHMNDDHPDALQLYAHQLLGQDGEGWRMVGIDPEGCDLRLGPRAARLVFGREVTDAATARAELVDLVGQARAPLDGSSAIP
ncbi:MAG: HugZ family protein [Geminicoccales bacterium]